MLCRAKFRGVNCLPTSPRGVSHCLLSPYLPPNELWATFCENMPSGARSRGVPCPEPLADTSFAVKPVAEGKRSGCTLNEKSPCVRRVACQAEGWRARSRQDESWG